MNHRIDFNELFEEIRTPQKPKNPHEVIARFMIKNSITSLSDLVLCVTNSDKAGWKEVLVHIGKETGMYVELPRKALLTAKKMKIKLSGSHKKKETFLETLETIKEEEIVLA